MGGDASLDAMPVNGPAGPVGPARPNTVQTDADPIVESPPLALTNTQDESALPGWVPNRTRNPRMPTASMAAI